MSTFKNHLALLVTLVAMVALLPPVASGMVVINKGGDLQQFTAGRHVVGFQSDSMYTVGTHYMLKVNFAGAAAVTPVSNSTSENRSKTPPLAKVTYENLWPGISLVYENTANGIVKSTYQVQPGADIGRIRLQYNAPVAVNTDGSLRFTLSAGQMRESAPLAWQDIADTRRPVQVAWLARGEREAGFTVKDYNPAYPVVIDPVLSLDWNTFMGSSKDDWGYGIAVDSIGNVYVSGKSYTTWGSPVNAHAGSSDAFAAKLNSSGTLLWNTFMGSSDVEYVGGIAVDSSGNVYVSGYSYATWGSPVNAHAGNYDAFAAKLNSSGALLWNTFMGSSLNESGRDIAVDSDGNVYVTGDSGATWGSPVNAHTGSLDAFAAKLNSGGALLWNTFMGSQNGDRGLGIAVDSLGNIYVSGHSSATWGSPVHAFA